MERAAEVIAALRDGRSLFLVHSNADPDAIGAALALQAAFGGAVAAPLGVSTSARRLLAHLGREVLPAAHVADHPRVVVVDSSSKVQVPDALSAQDLIIVDHHAYGDLLPHARLSFRDTARASCCEVALALVRAAGLEPARDEAFGLLVGVIADTARFRFADAASLSTAGDLCLRHGFHMKDALAVLEGDDDEEEGEDLPRRLAALKAGQRAEVSEVHGFLIATSMVGSFEAVAALALLRAGADLALVLAERGSAARLSARASPRLLARGVNLGEIASETAKAIGWSGGGHEAAAGLSGRPPGADAVSAFRERVMQRLKGAERSPQDRLSRFVQPASAVEFDRR